MATMKTLPKQSWKTYFDEMSHVLAGRQVDVEVASLDMGDQVVADALPLLGITYDDSDDLVDVSLGGLNHLIRHPTQVELTEEDGRLRRLAFTTPDGVEVLGLSEPLQITRTAGA